jgi:hypothetical protein
MVWLLLVWESFVVELRGIATTTIRANRRKGYVHLFAKPAMITYSGILYSQKHGSYSPNFQTNLHH